MTPSDLAALAASNPVRAVAEHAGVSPSYVTRVRQAAGLPAYVPAGTPADWRRAALLRRAGDALACPRCDLPVGQRCECPERARAYLAARRRIQRAEPGRAKGRPRLSDER